jgi:hypothetical protein
MVWIHISTFINFRFLHPNLTLPTKQNRNLFCLLVIKELVLALQSKGSLSTVVRKKQHVHSKYSYVCITNEDYTLQTCVYCFNKLDHPVYRKTIKDKEAKTRTRVSLICRNPSCNLLQTKERHNQGTLYLHWPLVYLAWATCFLVKLYLFFQNESANPTLIILNSTHPS